MMRDLSFFVLGVFVTVVALGFYLGAAINACEQKQNAPCYVRLSFGGDA